MFAATRSIAVKYGSKIAAATAAGAASLAHAEVPASVSTAISGAATDVGTIGAAVFGVAVAIVLFKWFRRAL